MPARTKAASAGKGKGGVRGGEGEGGGGTDALRKALLSIGVDKGSADKLLASRSLGRVVVPVFWKDGLVVQASSLWIQKLPGFLKSFMGEFPDGEVRWDPNYDEHDPDAASDVAEFKISFSYQEDDQGDHWSPRPTSPEEQSYQKMLKRFSYKGRSPVQAQTILHGR